MSSGLTPSHDRSWRDAGVGGQSCNTEVSTTNTPAGSIAATNVQAAIDELATEKAAAVHTHAAADVVSGLLALARVVSGTPNGTKFFRDDQTLVLPPGQVDVQVFTVPGANAWNKPTWATANSIVEFIGFGGGKGGAGGGYDPGDGMAVLVELVELYGYGVMLVGTELGASETVTVGAGGAGSTGAGNAFPTAGTIGGDSSFKTFVARGGGNAIPGVVDVITGFSGGPAGAGAGFGVGTAGGKAIRGAGGGGGGGGAAGTGGCAAVSLGN